jgi:hypothetical protein
MSSGRAEQAIGLSIGSADCTISYFLHCGVNFLKYPKRFSAALKSRSRSSMLESKFRWQRLPQLLRRGIKLQGYTVTYAFMYQ